MKICGARANFCEHRGKFCEHCRIGSVCMAFFMRYIKKAAQPVVRIAPLVYCCKVGFNLFLLSLFGFLTNHLEGDGSSQEDGRERAEHNAKNHGECERTDAVSTQEEDAE